MVDRMDQDQHLLSNFEMVFSHQGVSVFLDDPKLIGDGALRVVHCPVRCDAS